MENAAVVQVEEDATIYDDLLPWPIEADGGGKSLTRTRANTFGRSAASWQGQSPSPGLADLVLSADMDFDGDVDFDDIPAFLTGLNDASAYMARYGVPALLAGDANGDGTIDANDAEPLASILNRSRRK
jgi:hypothetical protein